MNEWNDDLAEAERRTAVELAPAISAHVALATHMTQLAGEILSNISQIELAALGPPHAVAIILGRLITDLRAAIALVRTGFVVQALSLAAGMLELANVAGFIGDDATRAQLWFGHEDPSKSYPPVRVAIQSTVAALGAKGTEYERIVKEEYEGRYRELCMLKHGNPIALGHFGLEVADDTAHIVVGPYLTSGVVRAARSALHYAVRYVWIGAMVFVRYHIPAEQGDALTARLSAIADAQQQLVGADKEHFDLPQKSIPSPPFPG